MNQSFSASAAFADDAAGVSDTTVESALEILRADLEIFNAAVRSLIEEVPGAELLLRPMPTDREGMLDALRERPAGLSAQLLSIHETGRRLVDVESVRRNIALGLILDAGCDPFAPQI